MKSNLNYIVIVLLVVINITGCQVFNNKSEKIKILDLKDGDKHLLFYGSEHSNDEKNPMFEDIKEKFHFINPEIVLVEGDYNNNKYSDVDNAIKSGESAYVTYLAQKENILIKSVEPSKKEQYQYLLNKYEKNSVLMMYVLRQTYQYQKQKDNKDINYKKTIKRYVYRMKKDGFPISDTEVSLENILSLLKQYTDKDIDNKNWIYLDIKAYVYRDKAKLNDIYNDILKFRNKHLIKTIEEVLIEYDKVFVIMGSGHVIEEEKRIIKTFDKVKNGDIGVLRDNCLTLKVSNILKHYLG
ncbi:MAG: TraB/GumN family protein [Firmicutes bacterium]|nr:TraB/GumN family protein [Bacillota bacterium]